MATITGTLAGVRLKRVAAVGISAAGLIAALAMVDVGAVAATVHRLPLATLVIVVVALTAGALLASARLACIAADVGYTMRASDAIAALSLGQLAGAVFFQIVGQLIARSAVLSRRGVPVSGTILVTGYERLLALLVSGGLAIAGAWFVFGRLSLELDAGGAMFLKLVAGAVAVIGAGAALAWGAPLAQFARATIGPHAVLRLSRSLLLSVGIQLCTMIAYIAAVLGLAPGMAFAQVAAAAAIVMLAAAIPISLAGWGVRELGAIYALGFIGLDRETSVVVAILVGTAALAVVAALATATAVLNSDARQPLVPRPDATFDTGAALAWGIPVLVALAVFFQVHVPLATSRLNVNMADPLALVGAAVFVADRFRAKRWPQWRLPLFDVHLGLMTLAVVVAFVHGWLDFGLTSWALTNRFAGWFVLLAYVATGSLVVERGAEDGLRLLLRSFAAAAIGIIVVDMIIFCLVRIGMPVPEEIIAYRIEGFAQNPNAFAMQIVFAIAAVVASIQDRRAQTLWLCPLAIGLWFSGSRSGLIAVAVLVIAALALRATRPTALAIPIAATMAAVAFVDWLPEIVVGCARAVQWTIAVGHLIAATVAGLFTSGGGESVGFQIPPPIKIVPPQFAPFEIVASGYDSSNVQRIASLQGGLAMFLDHPIFGAGLGAFTESYARAHGVPLVIHSTPLWLLAELGIVGLVVFAAPFVGTLVAEVRYAAAGPARTFIILLLLSFAAVAAVHDTMYQRVFWLLLGAALACRRPAEQRDQPAGAVRACGAVGG